jgi:HSP20 family protein
MEEKIMMPAKKHQYQRWMPSIFNDFLGNEWLDNFSNRFNSSLPAMNIVETEDAYKIEMAAPGLEKEDFRINLNNDNELVVSVEKKSENEEKDKKEKYLRREFSYTQFKQTLILPDNINRESIEATHNQGVLTITIKKLNKESKPEVKPIEVK